MNKLTRAWPGACPGDKQIGHVHERAYAIKLPTPAYSPGPWPGPARRLRAGRDPRFFDARGAGEGVGRVGRIDVSARTSPPGWPESAGELLDQDFLQSRSAATRLSERFGKVDNTRGARKRGTRKRDHAADLTRGPRYINSNPRHDRGWRDLWHHRYYKF